ncbi:4Fe-4S dicluster domain-containing protein [bacterium]|nr:4Fe-4S dicluster domain-containing protein [bacterium]
MDYLLRVEKSAEHGLIDFLKFLLENDRIGGVFTLRKTGADGAFDYGLIHDTALLEDAIPLHPFMPVNAAQDLSHFASMKKPIAVVIRPCELRAFIELVKRSQGSMDHFLMISYTCGGVFPFDVAVSGEPEKELPDYWESVARGQIFPKTRETCRACEHFVPMNADVTVSLIGETVNEVCIFCIHTEKAMHLAEGFESKRIEAELESPAIETLRRERQEEKKKLFENTVIRVNGLDGMIDMFGKCIGCHGCSRVCPICHCILCDFESHLFDYEPSMIEDELYRKGGVRLPTDTVLYHIGRLNHMSFSCVGCGMCTEVCPAGIPVAAIFMRTGEETAQLFDYLPGRDVEEEVPVTVYKEEELSTIGED